MKIIRHISLVFLASVAGTSAVTSVASNLDEHKKMVHVPGGDYWMGCNKMVDPDCFENEQPLKKKWISPFQIDKYEVSYDRYNKCVEEGECKPLGSGGSCNTGWDGMDDKPVNCVTWKNAAALCKYEGKRLPTEAEWEKAARGNTMSLYPWGNKAPDCSLAVMDGPQGGNLACGLGTPPPVGSKPAGASPYGALDMAGSMWEWTADWYGHNYYHSSPDTDPTGPLTGTYRVARGGDAYARKAGELRAVTRFFYAPENYSPAVGFRCAK